MSTPENLKKSKNRGSEKGKEVPKFGTPPNFSLFLVLDPPWFLDPHPLVMNPLVMNPLVMIP